MVWELIQHETGLVEFGLTMPDGHMGFPGRLNVIVTYQVKDTELSLKISAMCDKDTLCNFAPHHYFNLSGESVILNHKLQINSQFYLPVDKNNIPTGEIRSVKNTEFDLRSFKKLDKNKGLFDHNFCINSEKVIARLLSKKSKLKLDLYSDQLGLQVYDGRHISLSENIGLNGQIYNSYAGIALEPQYWPNAANCKKFSSIKLCKGDTYYHNSKFVFTQLC